MSKLSIYETRWIDLIFENKNKEYGAYQLRRDSVKSSLTALFMGLLFVASIGGVLSIMNKLATQIEPKATTTEWSKPIQLTDIYNHEPQTPPLLIIQNKVSKATTKDEQLINPIIVHSEEANQNIAQNTENTNTTDTTSERTGIMEQNPSGSETGNANKNAMPVAVDYGTSVVNTSLLDKLPEFPGGINKFYNYIGNHFEKPEIDEKIYKILVSFVIERDGSMTDIKVIKDPGFGMGIEAVRVLKSLKTKWSPGQIGSNPVRTAYTLPITVQMD